MYVICFCGILTSYWITRVFGFYKPSKAKCNSGVKYKYKQIIFLLLYNKLHRLKKKIVCTILDINESALRENPVDLLILEINKNIIIWLNQTDDLLLIQSIKVRKKNFR